MKKQTIEIGKVELRKMRLKLAVEERRKAKKAARKTDGLSPFLMQRYIQALRKVWRDSSQARKICVKRAELPGGYSRCENKKCGRKVPKTYIDHITPCGEFDAGYIERLSISSKGLQALCHECHAVKTRQDNARLKRAREAKLDFY